MEAQLPAMVSGYVPAQILYATAELGIADALADGPHGHVKVAERTGTEPAALRRLLRALVGLGLVEQVDADRFALTEAGGALRTAEPGSFRDHVLLSITPELWQAWGALTRVVRTGEPWRDPATGLTAHEAALRDPRLSALYRTAKAHATGEFSSGLTKVYDFSRFGTIADLGGDGGALMAALLAATPGLHGVLYDLPEARGDALATLEAAGVGGRCEVVERDPAGPVPPGADAYLINHLVRDVDDDSATALLAACRAAMAPEARLLLLETVMPPVLTSADSASYGLTDLNNLVYTGGRERTAEEYRRLVEAAGLTHLATIAVPAADGLPDYNVIETEPAR
ncbi:methyltransferase [Actinomadura spongiicola]|uniref:Methyltransferase n=1 Tax=Actinomadura spongiicola TaxID=2303421 RepID=A0A372GFL5_9ACTN|nr:methyltransferase [Actinomadura spongiicola]RFS84174.1 methyltransferase [Actinomadura spongiicola]